MYHLLDIDFLYLIFGFRGTSWQSFYLLLTKGAKDVCFSEYKKLHFQYNALRHLTGSKQSYCKNTQICTIFGRHRGYLWGKHRGCRAENDFVILKLLHRRYLFHTIGR